MCLVLQSVTTRHPSPCSKDHVCFLGGSRRQVNGTPQKGFVRPEQLLEGKVSLTVRSYYCLIIYLRECLASLPDLLLGR